MEIQFRETKFAKECNDQRLLLRKYGTKRARILMQRLTELSAANTLAELDPRFLPGPRCHELKGELAGQLSLDLDHPYRLLFRPAAQPPPHKADGGLDWTQVTAIVILGIEDTHD